MVKLTYLLLEKTIAFAKSSSLQNKIKLYVCVGEEKINVNIGKVGLQLSMTEVRSSCGAIEKALLIVLFLLKERFVSRFRPDGPVEISDYG